jgi:hypothetical protein
LNAKNDSRTVTTATGIVAHIQAWRNHTMRRTAIMLAGFVILLTIGATAQAVYV